MAAPPRQTLSYLANRFREVGLRIDRRLGQNFLIDLNLHHLLIDAAQLAPGDVVLEVGTGIGSLTALIAARAAAVVSVEVDPRLCQLAREELIEAANVTLLGQDALAGKHTIAPEVLAAVRRRLAEGPGRAWKLVANLPYHVATPLLSNLLALDDPPRSMTVTIQKELAQRIVASEGSKDYGALSIWVQCQASARIVRGLPPSVFWPRPKVHSAIVHVELDEARRRRIPDLAGFHAFIRALLVHRRKHLRAALAHSSAAALDKRGVDALLAQLDLRPALRAEQLDVPTLLALWGRVRQGAEGSA